ncbi:F-box/LRR-repeat protein 21-like [Ptychodera flava]|uniref:F-box/LRR-repeat protein 21-like n=1 Tax=Ptychodera flava TaxID=63121 RepID=UPI003969C020
MAQELDDVDFAGLPEPILVKIFNILNLTDRGRAAQVCRAWADAFNHPSVWDEAEVVLRAAKDEEEAKVLFNVYSLDHQTTMLQRFGKYLDTLTVSAIYLRTEFLSSDYDVLRAVFRNCSELDTLRIGVYGAHQIIKVVRFKIHPITTLKGLIPVHTIMLHLKRLRKFHLMSWPHKDPNGFTILTTMAMNDNISDIEELNLYWNFVPNNPAWAARILEMPESCEVSSCLNKFRHVKIFSIQMSILTDEIVSVFARPRVNRLAKFKILIAYQRGPGEFEKSVIPDSTWKAVRMNNPHMKVVFTFAGRIRQNDLLAIFQPMIPLQAVIFMKFSRATQVALEALATYYYESLEYYRDYSDSFGIDEDLIRIANRCTEMSRLIHRGSIHPDTVLSIAEVAGKRLKYFEVYDAKISTKGSSAREFYDDDEVFTVQEDGTYALVQQQLNKKEKEIEDGRTGLLEELYGKVSALLGRSWKAKPAPPEEYFKF